MNKIIIATFALLLSFTAANSQQRVIKVAGYLRPTDTASMLSPYLRSSVAAATYISIPRLNDSMAAVRNYALGLHNILLDSVAALREDIGQTGSGVTENDFTDEYKAKLDSAYIRSTRSSYLLNPNPVSNYDSLLFQRNDSVVLVRLLRVFAGSNKISVSKTVNDSSAAYSVDVNEANLTLANIGGNLPDAKLSSNVTQNTSTQTLSNKRITLRVQTSSGTTATPNVDSYDQLVCTNAGSVTIATPTGTPVDGQLFDIVFTNGGSIGGVPVGDVVLSGSTEVFNSTYRIYRFRYVSAVSAWVQINTSSVTSTNTVTLTNKRITQRLTTITSSSTPTPDSDASDMFTVTALAANATFAAPTGTPTDGQTLLIRIKDNGTARTLAWNAAYRAGDIALPTTTVLSKTMYCQFIYNSADSKWDFVGLTNNF